MSAPPDVCTGCRHRVAHLCFIARRPVSELARCPWFLWGDLAAPAAPPVDPAPRLAACHACEHYREGVDRCGLCGCADTMTRRAASPFGSCPGGRWPTAWD